MVPDPDSAPPAARPAGSAATDPAPRRAAFDPGEAPARKLLRLGLDPATVVDVGAADGTPHLLEAFPKAYHVLLEPLREFGPAPSALLGRHRGERVEAAVGARAGECTLHVEPERLVRSSVARRAASTGAGGVLEPRRVPVVTLDDVARRRALAPPFGLKIDTEGFELEVLRGAERFLRDTLFVVAEVSVARRFEGGYTFAQFVAAMDERGFRLATFLDMVGLRRPELLYVDAVFVR